MDSVSRNRSETGVGSAGGAADPRQMMPPELQNRTSETQAIRQAKMQALLSGADPARGLKNTVAGGPAGAGGPMDFGSAISQLVDQLMAAIEQALGQGAGGQDIGNILQQFKIQLMQLVEQMKAGLPQTGGIEGLEGTEGASGPSGPSGPSGGDD